MSRLRVPLIIALAVAAAGALLLRTVSIAEPLGIDQSLWASAVRGMSRGQLLYRDVWEQRPPGIYWTYLAAFNVFGWTSSAAVAWMDLLAAVATTLLLFGIARRIGDALTGTAAAALYAALTMPAWLYRYGGFLERSVCETFIVVCIGASFWCAVRLRERATLRPAGGRPAGAPPASALPVRALLAAAGVGFFAGAAVVFKPNAGLYFLAVLAWLALYLPRASAGDRRAIGVSVIVAVVASAIMPVLAVAWLWRLGLLADAKTAVVDFNRFYVSQGFTLGGYARDFSKAIWFRIETDPLWLAGGVGSLVALWSLARTRRLSPVAGLAMLWGAAAALVIIVNGARLFNTYFIQAFAPLAVLSAWLLTAAARESRLRGLIAGATGLLMAIVLLQRHYPAKVLDSASADFDLLRGRLDRTAYLDQFGGYGNRRGYSARANEELATYVRAHTAPEDRIYLLGINGAGIYFAADRLTAHRFLRVNFFVPAEFPDPAFRLQAVLDDLAARRPRYLIFERLNSSSEMAKAVDSLTEQPEVIRLLAAYQLETQIEDFSLYRLRD
jgi:4-amino-4-deoxy-L-arabinose transferase-like glycosyltransferase